MLDKIRELLELIATRASNRETIDELLVVIGDRERWRDARDIFRRVRAKALRVDPGDDRKLSWQYSFEEICAKCIYNESDTDVPFDSDSPLWVVPITLDTARAFGIDQERVLDVFRGGDRALAGSPETFEQWWVRFGATGNISPLALGMTRQQLVEELGRPHDYSTDRKTEDRAAIWKYGSLEFHFDVKGLLRLIFMDTADGVLVSIPRLKG